MKYINIFISIFIFTISTATQAATKKSNPQVIDFNGIDISTSKGTPRDAFISTKKSADFEYFFDTKMSFKKKIINSLEGVR